MTAATWLSICRRLKPASRALGRAADLTEQDLGQGLRGEISSVEVMDRRGKARNNGLVEADWQDVLGPALNGGVKSAAALVRRPHFVAVGLGNEHDAKRAVPP